MSSPTAIDARLSGLIGRFYEAATDEALWAGIAPEIAAALDSTSAVLKLHGADDDIRLLDNTDNLLIPDDKQSWAADWHQRDLWVRRSARFGVSQVVTDQDLVSPAEQRKSGFYQEWLHSLDIHHMAGAIFPAGDGVLGVLGVHRPKNAEPYENGDRHKVSVLLPHLQRALWIGQQLSSSAARQAVAEEVLARVDAAVFAVDTRRRIVMLNQRADTLLRENSGLGSEQGRLGLQDDLLDQRMTRQILSCIDTAGGRPAPPGSAMTIPRTGRLPLTMIMAPLPMSADAAQARPLALVIVRDPEAATVTVTGLRRLFDFTRMEALVAADLACGMSLDNIASRRGIGAATVRSHLKGILSKTGTHRQAEAVALIARSVAGLDTTPEFLP